MAMQYKIPQDVDVEDKIFGPLSLRQFTWLVIGGFATFVLYAAVGKQSFFAFLLVSLPVIILFLALAFVRINQRPFELFLVSSFRAFLRPRQRVWQRIEEPQLRAFNVPPEVVPISRYKPGITEVKSQLEELTLIVDTRGWGSRSAADQRFMAGNRVVSAPEQAPQEHEPEDVMETKKAGLNAVLAEAHQGHHGLSSLFVTDPAKRHHRRHPYGQMDGVSASQAGGTK